MQKHFFIFFLFLSFIAYSSHNRSGEITYERIPPYTAVSAGATVQVYWYLITVTKYTDDNTQLITSNLTNLIADRCAITIYFGDSDSAVVSRVNGPSPLCTGCLGCNCDHCGDLIINENDGYRVKKNIYQIKHQYPQSGSFLIRTTDPYRNADVQNMSFSDKQDFYLESLLMINSLTGPNNSPVFTVDPIDKACVGKCFTHNPGAYDPDHDSLSFKLSTPKGSNGQTVLGYYDPPTLPGGTFNINVHSGTLTWCSPTSTMIGEFNIAFIVEEWRKNTSGHPEIIGTVLRDMQVVVRACPSNNPPMVVVPQDTCVEAGTLIHKKISVSDPDLNNFVTVTGYGGAFSCLSPNAVLTNTSALMTAANGKKFSADFSWQTSCSHIAQQYYQTIFKAEDTVPSQNMAAFNVYNIRVIPPSVKNVTASPVGTAMKISWSLSTCSPTNNPLIAYKIYRQEGCTPYVPDACQRSIPPSSGFTFIGRSNDTTAFFVDNNNGDGLVVGQNYSYLVVALYKDSVESFGSTQVCAKLKRDIPVLLNVDVLSTSSSSGSIRVRWSRPLKTPGNLDTIAFPGPYTFNLKYRGSGVYSTIFSSTKNYLYQLDTVYDHTGINTTLDSNMYLVEFVAAGTVTIGSSQKASSVFLSATTSDRKVNLQWKCKTPWRNYTYTIFRKAPGSSTYTAIGTSTTTSFSDVNRVVNKKNYCYYVSAEGAYSDPGIPKPLINRSQEICVVPLDLTPPCTPTLTIDANCPTGFVNVTWKNVRAICSDDVIDYILYYKNTVEDQYQKVFEGDTTLYLYDGESLISGCYAIQAKDSSGNISALSPDFCIDNCPEFELPNIFSPNKDGVNDFFKAIKVRQIKEIDLVIVDRWGNLMYRTKDPYFEWDGINIQSKQAVSDGTFFYVCTVFEPHIKGITKRALKGNVQVVR